MSLSRLSMVTLQIDTIRQIADSPVIFKRGEFLQRNGAFSQLHEQSGEGRYVYEVDGNYGNYRTEVVLNGAVSCQCDCRECQKTKRAVSSGCKSL